MRAKNPKRLQTAAYIFSKREEKLFTSISRNFHLIEHSKLSGSRTSAWSHCERTWNWTTLDKFWIVVVFKGNTEKESMSEWPTLNIYGLTYHFFFFFHVLYPARVLSSHINPSDLDKREKSLEGTRNGIPFKILSSTFIFVLKLLFTQVCKQSWYHLQPAKPVTKPSLVKQEHIW